jgi:hypothetical protein
MKKWMMLLVLLFLVKIKVPFGADITYKHVLDVTLGASGSTWQLTLSDGRKAYVPFMWTTIEEEKEEDGDK